MGDRVQPFRRSEVGGVMVAPVTRVSRGGAPREGESEHESECKKSRATQHDDAPGPHDGQTPEWPDLSSRAPARGSRSTSGDRCRESCCDPTVHRSPGSMTNRQGVRGPAAWRGRQVVLRHTAAPRSREAALEGLRPARDLSPDRPRNARSRRPDRAGGGSTGSPPGR